MGRKRLTAAQKRRRDALHHAETLRRQIRDTAPVDDRRSVRTLVLLALLGLALFNAGTTIGRHTGPDFARAAPKGTATVEQCQRRGPLTLFEGVGFYDSCLVWAQWSDGRSERLRIDDAGFFRGEKPGDTLRIGYDMSRPEVRHWSALQLVMYLLCGLGGLLFVGTALALIGRFTEWMSQ
ncbi:DUF6346 domain-containing protein [Actinoplanes sp. NEAU-A12]|uniref:DUF6346 domain-containing protein n=1 Tax=Actinoplanes sandaracinus TaxID=3045177 RepID=A0ABT6WQ81_9ACTN|nr:DUF6346 domain-containing protein [Actinoplanes sandaracinus]MDI6101795.1 DUF6346 domain-containing protein [Actinoplanes sandaracinus]